MATTYHFPVIIEQDEDGMYIATVPALRGCITQGRTLDELDANVKEAIALCLEVEQEAKEDIPQNKFVGVHDLEVAV